MLQFFLTARAGALADAALQITVQQFIRVILRRVWWQMENLKLILVLVQPMSDYSRMMNPQIVQDQEYLLLAVVHETPHKINQFVAVHVVLV